MANQDVHDVLTALSAAGVRHLVVGAYALAHHGRVRATGDIDILVMPSPATARRLRKAIQEFAGCSLEYFGVTEAELGRPGVGFYMGVEPDRIDILTKVAGLSFERAWKGREKSEIEGAPTMVLGFDDLIAAKRASAKKRVSGSAKALQDAADLAWLLEERDRRRTGP